MPTYHPTLNTKPLKELKWRDKAWWTDNCGHEWETKYDSIKAGQGCPICAGKIILSGFNDLKSQAPEIAAEWHPTKNTDTPETMALKSSKKVWWLGGCGHEWETKISNRTARNSGCPICAGRIVLPGFNDLASLDAPFVKEWHPTKNLPLTPEQVSRGNPRKVWWLGQCGHEWQDSISHRKQRRGCPPCSTKINSSLPELDIYNHVRSIFPDVKRNIRNIIFPYELDIFIPTLNIAVEYNGLYWHSEKSGKTPLYHYTKWKLCKEKGIQLIQVWEDDWKKNPTLIRNMISHKLGRSAQRKIFARKTFISNIPQWQADIFLNEFHIQGTVDGGIRVGLFENATSINTEPELVAVMVLKHEPGTNSKTFNLLRFASSAQIQGGFTKLLKYVEKTYSPEKIVTFSDNTISDGNLYSTTGFTAVKQIKPDYMYIFGHKRVHKFSFRLKRFKNDPNLKFEENLSEKQLASLNDLDRIWDAGKIKWEKQYIVPKTP